MEYDGTFAGALREVEGRDSTRFSDLVSKYVEPGMFSYGEYMKLKFKGK